MARAAGTSEGMELNESKGKGARDRARQTHERGGDGARAPSKTPRGACSLSSHARFGRCSFVLFAPPPSCRDSLLPLARPARVQPSASTPGDARGSDLGSALCLWEDPSCARLRQRSRALARPATFTGQLRAGLRARELSSPPAEAVQSDEVDVEEQLARCDERAWRTQRLGTDSRGGGAAQSASTVAASDSSRVGEADRLGRGT